MAHDEPAVKKMKHSVISEHMYDAGFQELFSKHWDNYTAVKNDDFEIILTPFRVCKISNLLKSKDAMDKIKSELLDLKTKRNAIDLYQYEQSNDLANVNSVHIKSLFATFQTDLVSWMEKNTKIDLNKNVSISSSRYTDTDYLLCHDDNMGDRRIAFILYLSENWKDSYGGALDLFDTDKNGLPKDIVRSLVPEYNSLVFFEVTENSFHQVAEVVTKEKIRWTISGWFHGKLIEREKSPRPLLYSELIEPDSMEYDLRQWVRPCYLNMDNIKDIQKKMEEESSSFIMGFFLSDVYEYLSQEVINEKISWKKVGPADQRNYEVADEDSLPESLKAFYNLFKSKTMFTMLQKLTELDLHPDNENMKPKMRIELQRWNVGCYTLLPEVYDTTAAINDKKSVINNESGEEDKNDVDNNLKPDFCQGNGSGNYLGEAINTPPSSDDETPEEIRKRVMNGKYKQEMKSNIHISSSSSSDLKLSPTKSDLKDGSDSGEADIEENADDEIKLRILTRRPRISKRVKVPLSDFEMSRGTDSEESDIEDYLSDPNEYEEEERRKELKKKLEKEEDLRTQGLGGSLDVILQFHTHNVPGNITIDYVCPREESALIHVPAQDNYLCLAYKMNDTFRIHNYVNHYCKGYYYNIVCTYYE